MIIMPSASARCRLGGPRRRKSRRLGVPRHSGPRSESEPVRRRPERTPFRVRGGGGPSAAAGPGRPDPVSSARTAPARAAGPSPRSRRCTPRADLAAPRCSAGRQPHGRAPCRACAARAARATGPRALNLNKEPSRIASRGPARGASRADHAGGPRADPDGRRTAARPESGRSQTGPVQVQAGPGPGSHRAFWRQSSPSSPSSSSESSSSSSSPPPSVSSAASTAAAAGFGGRRAEPPPPPVAAPARA
jgi:hypothetical protein